MVDTNSQYTVSVKVVGEQDLRKLQTQLAGLNTVAKRLPATVKQLPQVGRGFRGLGFQVQNASYQIQDFIVQVQGGTSATYAFSQQAPQLLGSFGAIGAAVGVLGALLPTAIAYFRGLDENATGLAGSLRDMTVSMTSGLVQGFRNAVINVKMFWEWVTRTEAVIEVMKGALVSLGIVIGVKLIPVIHKLTLALRGLSLSNAITAFALLAVTAAVYIMTNWQSVAAFFRLKVPAMLKDTLAAWKDFKATLLLLMGAIFAPVEETFRGGINVILRLTREAMQEISGYVNDYAEGLSDVPFFGGLSDGMKGFAASIGTAASNIKDLEKSTGLKTLVVGAKNATEEAKLLREESAKLTDQWKEFKAVTAKPDPIPNPTIPDPDELTELEKEMKRFRASASSSIESGIINAAKNGKAAFSDMANSIIEDIARMIIRLNIIKPLMAQFGGGDAAAASANGNYFPNGIFQKPLSAFSVGGVIGSRGVFGSNLIGEAGPEAVVPLRRHSGRMGVESSPVNINVINNAGADVQISQAKGNDGSKTIDVIIEQKVKNAIGSGALDRAFSSRYSLRPVGA